MSRTLADVRRWADEGTELISAVITGLTEAELDAPSTLPGWSRKHVVAHVAANANALANLVHWAGTGEVTPMYPSSEARAAGIKRGAGMPAVELIDWLEQSALALTRQMGCLTDAQWRATVVSAQGRSIPASEIPWLRSREVFVHAVDLEVGIAFADLPDDFLLALAEDICAKRDLSMAALPTGPLAEVTAWLAGRPHALAGAPKIGAWL